MKTHQGRGLALAAILLCFSSAVFPAYLQDDVSGTWSLSVETQRGTATPTVTLKQAGERITGSYKGRLGDSTLEGTIKGNEIRFAVKLKFQDQEVTITYSGTVEKDSMKGTAQFGDRGSGPWTATRKPE